MIDNQELLKTIIAEESKFDYAFATLNFGVLALSIQFSPSYGDTWKYLLVACWVLLLFSALLAGHRIIYKLVATKINYQINRNEHYKQHAGQMIDAKKRLPMTRLIKPDGSEQTLEDLESGINTSMSNIKTGNQKFDQLNKKLSKLYWVQLGSFLLGLVCNLVFISANYLYR